MNDFDTYIAHLRAHADARKPMTAAEKQFIAVYLGLVAIAATVAYFVR